MISVPAVVGAIGGGRMGAGIAQSFATAGSAVTVVESGEQARPRHWTVSPPD